MTGEPGKAELKALEEEFLSDIGKEEPAKHIPKRAQPGVGGRARPKGQGSVDLSVKAPEQEEEEEDPFDTTIADKVIPVRKAKKSDLSLEDEEFDPTASFQRSVSEAEKAAKFKELQQADSIDSDDFDPRAF